MRLGIGLGLFKQAAVSVGVRLFSAYKSRVIADGGITEADNCAINALNNGLFRQASLLLIPSGYKSGKAYAEIPTNGNGDLTWTRASTALRTNSSGLLESMGSGVPRLSYMYGSCPALLLEPQRTNLALQSESFDSASWTKLNSSITANTTTSPDGTTNADSLIENSLLADHNVIQSSITVANASAYTCSVYFKANTRTKAAIQLAGTAFAFGGNGISIFDLSSGTVVSSVNGATATIQSVGNGWYRCTATKTTVSTSGIISFNLVDSSNNLTYTGNGTSGVFLWGAQLELGAYATTIIPTTTASATRIADSFSRNNIYTNGLITSSGGTWFVELRNNIAYPDGTFNNFLFVANSTNFFTSTACFSITQFSTANERVSITKRVGSTNTQLFLTTTSTVKIAIKWNGTTADIFANGTKVVSATSFTATNMENLIGGGDRSPLFIQQIALYPSPLSDTDCTTLTTL